MSEQPTNPNTNVPQDSAAATQTKTPPVKKRRRFLWLKLLGVLVVLLLLLVIFAPAIASTGVVRNIVVSKVNEQLNGVLSISDWSIGWGSGIEVQGIKITRDGQMVVDVPSVRTDLSLLDAMHGNFNLGQVPIEFHINAERDANGELNLAKLVKENPKAGSTAQTSTGGAGNSAASSRLPNVSGTLVVKPNSSVTFKQAGMDTLNIGVSGQIKIADLNKPIDHQIEIPVQLGNGPKGKITIAGKASVIQNNVVAIDKASVDETVKLENISLASILPLIPPSVGITTLKGDTNGQIALKLMSGTDAQATMNLTSSGFALGGPALKGDVYSSQSVVIAAPATTIVFPAGLMAADQAHIKITPDNKGDGLTLTLQQGSVKVGIDAGVQALMNVAQNQKPGAEGNINLEANFDLGPLATMLRNTLHLRPDVELRKAKFTNVTTITMTADDAKIHQDVKLQGVEVQNTVKNQPVKVGDVMLAADMTSIGGGQAIPDLRDITVDLKSDFANANFKGNNLWDLSGTVQGTLDAVQREAAQVVNLDKLDMKGAFQVNLSSTGDLSKEGGTSQTKLTANVSDLHVSGLADLPPLDQPNVLVSVVGSVLRGKQIFVSEVRDVDVHVSTGADQQRSIDIEASGNVAWPDAAADTDLMKQLSATYEIKRGAVDVARLFKEFAPLAQKYAKDLNVSQGTIAFNSKGAYSAEQVTFEGGHFQLADVSAQNTAAKPVPTDVLQRFNAVADFDGRYIMQGGGQDIRLKNLKLALSDLNSKDILNITKDNVGREMFATFSRDGGFTSEGKLQMGMSLGWLNQTLKRLNGGAVQAQVKGSTPAEIRSGYLSGAVDIVSSNDPKHPGTALAVNYKITNLTVASDMAAVLQGETVGIDGYAVAAPDLSGVYAQNLNVASRFANVRASDIVLKLKSATPGGTVGPLEMVQSAKVVTDVPDLKQLGALLNAISPPAATVAPTASAGATAGAPAVGPLVFNSGKLNAMLNVTHDDQAMVVDVTNISGDDISFTRGPAAYHAQPFKIVTQARLTAATGAGVNGAAPVSYITSVDVPVLNGTLGVADIALAKPIALKNLGSLTYPTATSADAAKMPKFDPIAADGQIKVSGQIEAILTLLNALGGDNTKPALSGALAMTQSFSTSGSALTTSGTIDVSKFKAVGSSGTFSEDLVRLANQISLDPTAKAITIDNVDLNMQSSQALSISIKNGKVERYDTDRAINIAAAVKYDTGKLLQIIRPMLSPEMQQKLASAKAQPGTITQVYTIDGTYPAGKTFEQAIRGLTAKGAVVLPGIDASTGMGVTIDYLELPITLQNGVMSTGFAAQTQGQPYRPNAMLNGGVVNLGNLDIDLTDARMPVTSKAEKQFFLIRNVKVNPIFADTFMAKLVPTMFQDASKANGMVEVSVVKIDHLSLAQFYEDKNVVVKLSGGTAGTPPPASSSGDSAFEQWKKGKEPAPDPSKPVKVQGLGYAELLFSMSDVEIGNPLFVGLINAFHANAMNDSFKGSIKNSRIILDNGQVTNDVTLAIGKYPMSFKGGFNLVSGALNPGITANIPSGLFGITGKSALEFFSLPIKGTIEHQEYDIGKLVLQAGFQTGLDSLIGGKKDDKNKNNAAGQNNNDNPLGGILDQLGKDKDKKKK